MVFLLRIISFVLGYAFGNISPGLIIARFYKVDLRKTGSGNTGSTNVARTFGFGVGLINLFFDFLKALVPAGIVFLIFKNNEDIPVKVLMAYAAFGAVFGHIFPVIYKFKGGKGIATNIGLILVTKPFALIPGLITMIVTVIFSRYVSLGSLLCAVVVPLQFWIFAFTGLLGLPFNYSLEIAILYTVDAIICSFMHRGNIKRIINGTENKFSFHRNKEAKNGKGNN